MDIGSAVPQRVELLHGDTRTGSTAARGLRRLDNPSSTRSLAGGHPVSDAGRGLRHGAQLPVCRGRQHRDRRRAVVRREARNPRDHARVDGSNLAADPSDPIDGHHRGAGIRHNVFLRPCISDCRSQRGTIGPCRRGYGIWNSRAVRTSCRDRRPREYRSRHRRDIE